MTTRFYTNLGSTKFEKIAIKLGAEYIEDRTMALFIPNCKWNKVDEHKEVKPAIMWTSGNRFDIGQVKRDCLNFEDRTDVYYTKKDLEWIIETLTKLKREVIK